MEQFWRKAHRDKFRKLVEDGFSLLELVVAVGILLILSVGGLVSWGPITKRARQAAVNSAASEVLTGAMAYEHDSSPKVVKDAETEWNATSKKDKSGKAHITVEAIGNSFCVAVKATHAKGEESVRASGNGCPDDIQTGDYFGPGATPLPEGSNSGNENPGGNGGTTNPGDNGDSGNSGDDGTKPGDNGNDGSTNPGGDDDPSGEHTGASNDVEMTIVHERPVPSPDPENEPDGVEMEAAGFVFVRMKASNEVKPEVEIFAKDLEGMPVGTKIQVSEWITNIRGFEASSSLSYVETRNGMVTYKNTSENAAGGYWFKVHGSAEMTTGSLGNVGKIRVVLPGDHFFGNTPSHGTVSGETFSWDRDMPWVPLFNEAMMDSGPANKYNPHGYFEFNFAGTGRLNEQVPVGTEIRIPTFMANFGNIFEDHKHYGGWATEIVNQDSNYTTYRTVQGNGSEEQNGQQPLYFWGEATERTTEADIAEFKKGYFSVEVKLPRGYTFVDGKTSLIYEAQVSWDRPQFSDFGMEN